MMGAIPKPIFVLNRARIRDDNIIIDLLTRWAKRYRQSSKVCRIELTREDYIPTTSDAKFKWPTSIDMKKRSKLMGTSYQQAWKTLTTYGTRETEFGFQAKITKS